MGLGLRLRPAIFPTPGQRLLVVVMEELHNMQAVAHRRYHDGHELRGRIEAI